MPKWLWALTGLAVIAVAVYIAVLFGAPLPFVPAPHDESIACTADAMQCPDGSWVGRSGPNCQFVCPAATSTGTTSGPAIVTAHVGETVTGLLGIRIEPLKVIEDSRCPVDVQCIQAGRVRLEAQIVDGMGTSTETFIVGTPITLEAASVTLVSVAPARYSQTNLKPSDYIFTFEIRTR